MKNTLETRLGIFLALAAVAAIVILEMAGGSDFFKPGYQLRARFSNVQELKEGDAVKMAGKQVGRVVKIDFAPDEDKVEVTMKLARGVLVKTDSKAAIKFAGLMGQNFVSLNLGAAKTAFEKDSLMQSVEQPDLSALMAKLESVASGVENLTKSFSGDSLQNIMGPFTDFLSQNRANLTFMISNMKVVSDNLSQGKGTLGKLINDDALYTSALDTVKSLNETTADIKLVLGDAKAALGEAKLALGDARVMVNEMNTGKGSMGKLLKDETLYRETTLAMTNLKEIFTKINQGQGSVGKLVNDDSLFKNVKMTLQKVEKATEGLEDSGPLSVLGTMANSLF